MANSRQMLCPTTAKRWHESAHRAHQQKANNNNNQATHSVRAETNLAQRSDVANFIEKTHNATGIDKHQQTDTILKTFFHVSLLHTQRAHITHIRAQQNWRQRYKKFFVPPNYLCISINFSTILAKFSPFRSLKCSFRGSN